MSLTRRTRRESERQQAQLRLRRRQVATRKRRARPRAWRDLPHLLWQRKTLAVIAALALGAIIAIPVFAPGAPLPTTTPDPQPVAPPTAATEALRFDQPPPFVLETGSRYAATIQSSKGIFEAELLADRAPDAVNNLVFLARNQFYTQAQVTKVDPGQRVELGGQEQGGASVGYTIPLSPTNEQPAMGSLVAINKGGGMASEFAVLLSDPLPDHGATVLGRITGGLDVVRQLRQGDRIQSVRIQEITGP